MADCHCVWRGRCGHEWLPGGICSLRSALFSRGVVSEKLRWAFLEDLAVVRDQARTSALESFTGELPMWPESTEAFERLRTKLDSPDDVEALAAVVEEFVHVALHSVLVAVDGGSASAEVGRVTLVDGDGESLGEGLHELYVGHLFDTGRMQ